MYTFNTPDPVNLQVELSRGLVRIIAEDCQTTRIELTPIDGDFAAQALIDAAEVTQDGNAIQVKVPPPQRGFLRGFGGKVLVTIHLPTGSRGMIRVHSASVEAQGRLGDLRVHSASGRIRIEDAGAVEAYTGSGEIRIGHASGPCDARTGSGPVEIESAAGETRLTSNSGAVTVGKAAGALKATTGSGEVKVGRTGPEADLFAASGRVTVDLAGPGRLRARTASGEVRIGVTRGLPTWLDVRTTSGAVRSRLEASSPPGEGEDHLKLVVHTTSGGVVLDHADAFAA